MKRGLLEAQKAGRADRGKNCPVTSFEVGVMWSGEIGQTPKLRLNPWCFEMKVDRPDRTTASGLVRGKKKAAAGGKFVVGQPRAEVSTPSVSGLGPVTAVDALLAAQESDGHGSRRQSKGYRTAEAMLDLLQQVQRGLLKGQISVADLRRLKTLVSEKRTWENDPKLAQILNDIELRAAVELAKLGQEI